MTWIFAGLSAHFFWALTNTGDKFLVGNRISNPYVYNIWINWLGAFSLFAVPFVSFSLPSNHDLFVLALASIIYFFAGIFYIKAVQIEEITRINIWWSLIPFMSLVLSFVIFGDVLKRQELFGLSILLAASLLAALHIGQKVAFFSRGFFLMIVSCFLFALYAVLFHELTATISFISGFMWMHIMILPITALFFLSKSFRAEYREETKKLKASTVGLFAGIGVVNHLGTLANQWALSLAPAALAFSLESSQAIFVFLITVLVGFHNKELLKEEFDTKNVALKLLAMCLMIVGVFILGSA